MKKILSTLFILIISIFSFTICKAQVFEFNWWTGEESVKTQIEKVSTHLVSWNEDLATNIEENWINILKAIKWVVWWVLIIFMVYTWVMMIMSMWSDEEQLSSSKRQIRYLLIAFLFINMPWALFTSFHKEDSSTVTVDQRMSTSWFTSDQQWNNIIVNSDVFVYTVNENILLFMKVIIWFIAVAVLTFSWLKILSARWREEQVTEAKWKIIYSIAWLIFIWIAEVWKNIAFSWNISDWKNLFEQLSNLALYFAWPIWISFLILAWYYMITSNWDEEKVKKAKNIVINTVIATVILLASYSFLLDLADL